MSTPVATRSLRCLFVLLTTCLLSTALHQIACGGQRPNVLFLASDDMRSQLGCYGDPLVKSPNLDKLAAEGRLFQRAYCQQALCSPSRISLLSGRYPWTSGIHQIGPTLRSKLPDVVTLPQHFKNQGYEARSLGKIYHVGIDDPDSWSVPSWVSRKPRYGPVGTAAVKAKREAMMAAGKKEPERGAGKSFYAGPAFENADPWQDEDMVDGDTARQALAVMRELAEDTDKPFFLAVGFHNPHVPWVAPAKYFDLYDVDSLPLPDYNFVRRGAPPFAATSGQDFYWYGNVPRDKKITPQFGRECLQGYLAAISYIDAQVGLLVDELDQLGLRENTIVVFWGDHGYYMGEHSWWGSKHNNYEGATKVPLIIRAPGMKRPGASTDALVELIDLFPTLVQLAGLPPASGVEGDSLVPLLEDPMASWNKPAFSSYPKQGYLGKAMRTERFRYVEWSRDGKLEAVELYDHQKDPQENQNVAGDPAYAQAVEELAARMQAELN